MIKSEEPNEAKVLAAQVPYSEQTCAYVIQNVGSADARIRLLAAYRLGADEANAASIAIAQWDRMTQR